MTVLGLDPGQKTGWALFVKHQLDMAGVLDLSLKSASHPTVSDRINKIPGAATVAIEMPRYYPKDPKTRRIDVNDLLDLSVLVGRFLDNFEYRGCRVELIWPRTWKGTVPKEIMSQRIIDALTEHERMLLPRRPRASWGKKDAGAYDHNMLDACGLALWKLGRLG